MNEIQSKFELQTLSSIKPCLNQTWRWKKVLPSVGVVFIYGPPAAGKTFFTICAGLSIAAGMPIAGEKTIQCGVVYCSAEGGVGIKTRVSQAKETMNLPASTPFSLITVAPNLGEKDGDTDELIRAIKLAEERHQTQYKVVVLDPLARVMTGLDENSTRDAGIFINNAERLAHELNALVIVVHHSGKNVDNGMRGSSALLGAVDTVLKVDKRHDYIWLNIEKQRDGSDNLGFSFQLKTVDVGTDQDGESVTTCVLDKITALQRSDAKSLSSKKQTLNDRKFTASLDQCLKSHGREVPSHDDTTTMAVERRTLEGHFVSTESDAQKPSRKRAFARCLEAAIDRLVVGSAMIDGVEMIWRLEK
jgi:hypothetical protein